MAEVTIYTKPFCPYCERAMSVLQQKDATVVEIVAAMDPDKKREMIERSGRRTFPQIFIGDRHIGGCDDLIALDRQGELDPLLSGG